jgi:hypothetical protein
VNASVNQKLEVGRHKTLISVLELKRLLTELKDKRQDICFRYRLIGEMWKRNFFRILKVTEKGVVLNDAVDNKLIFLNDLTAVMQFEIDAAFQAFEPHFHYEVSPFENAFAC